MIQKYIIATVKSWNIKEADNFISNNPKLKIFLITNKKDLEYKNVSKINPRYIFFPHWSWKIPKKIFENFECIIFHMTDLPFGRGGNPLQNLIIRGYKKTKISAIKANNNIDAGPVYLKNDLSLDGSAREIFERASKIVIDNMIPYIIKNEPSTIPQKGNVVSFKRRKVEDSNLSKLTNLNEIYDFIRMLDAEGYPLAYIENNNFKIEFSDAKLNNGIINCKAKIKKMDGTK